MSQESHLQIQIHYFMHGLHSRRVLRTTVKMWMPLERRPNLASDVATRRHLASRLIHACSTELAVLRSHRSAQVLHMHASCWQSLFDVAVSCEVAHGASKCVRAYRRACSSMRYLVGARASVRVSMYRVAQR